MKPLLRWLALVAAALLGLQLFFVARIGLMVGVDPHSIAVDRSEACRILHDQGRVEYAYATDEQALDAFTRLARLEGIIPALESSHAVAEAIRRAPTMPKDSVIVVNLSGRGDTDVAQVASKIGLQMPV